MFVRRCRASRASAASFAAHGAGVALAVAALAACSGLPVINPDLALERSKPVQIEGVRGPLTTAQSKALLARLQKNGEDTSIFERHLALEQSIVDSPLTSGNKVVLLQNGPDTYSAMFAAIERARDNIHVESYIIEDGEVGNRFADALIAKQLAGVPVSLIYDSVGSLATAKAFFQRLIDAGIKVVEFNPINPLTAKAGWQVNHRDHRKLMIVDGRIAFLGGINISSVYSSGSFGRRASPAANAAKAKDGAAAPWRDTDLQVQGPVVAEFQKLFLATWAMQKGDVLDAQSSFPALTSQGDEVVRAIGSSPDQEQSQTLMYQTLMSAINSAESSVNLTNAYFVPDAQLLVALKAAAARGAEVQMILPGNTDSWLVYNIGRSHYGELLKGGVKIYQRRGALLHAKTAVIDGVWSTVGSTNLDWRSFLHNDEVNAVILGQGFAGQMQAMFAADLAASDPVTLEAWQRRPLLDRMREMVAWIWEYWL